jgi:hypothetical protein
MNMKNSSIPLSSVCEYFFSIVSSATPFTSFLRMQPRKVALTSFHDPEEQRLPSPSAETVAPKSMRRLGNDLVFSEHLATLDNRAEALEDVAQQLNRGNGTVGHLCGQMGKMERTVSGLEIRLDNADNQKDRCRQSTR